MLCRDALLVIALVATRAHADDSEIDQHLAQRLASLAEHHYRAGEYYRAITDYEELALFATDDTARAHSLIRIAMSYHRAHQLHDATSAYRVALAATHDPALAQALRIQLALARAERTFDEPGAEALDVIVAELAPSATSGTYRELALYDLARIQALAGQRDAARASDRALTAACLEPSPSCRLEPILARALAVPAAPRRAPWLGVALSAIVPGAGSVYGGHLVDGLYYFGLTTLSGLGAWNVHDPSRSWTDQKATFYGLTTLAAIFYVSNVLSGYISVARHNMVIEHDDRLRLWSATDQPLPLE
jgi:tetratricopeptide (TPR) repeat protein